MIRLVLFGLVLSVTSATAANFTGSADKIIDGDTFWLCDLTACHKIRVCGINAPERGEAGSHELRDALAGLMKGIQIRCVQVGEGTPCDGRSKPTNGDRIVAQCYLGNGSVDIADQMVKQGFACDWVKFSGGRYSNDGIGKRCP